MKRYYIVLGLFLTVSVQAFIVEQLLEEVDHKHQLYPTEKPYKEGYLSVSDLHTIFYAAYGNPHGIPVIILHGGPGGGCSDAMTKFFDLEKWHVIMFDQRGAMRSEPFGCMQENSPQHSVGDIEKLRELFGIERWVVFGGSYGSCLAVLYGQAHPERCLGFILRGITLHRPQDNMHLFYDMGKIFPEAYEPMVEHIPQEEREDMLEIDGLLAGYYRRVMDPDPAIHMPAARAFMKFDQICATHCPDEEGVKKLLADDKKMLSVARSFIYHAYHQFFLEPDQILANMSHLAHLPAIIVQGRWDAICLPGMAYELHKHWPNSKLWFVIQGGHAATNPAIAASLATATDIFAQQLSGLCHPRVDGDLDSRLRGND